MGEGEGGRERERERGVGVREGERERERERERETDSVFVCGVCLQMYICTHTLFSLFKSLSPKSEHFKDRLYLFFSCWTPFLSCHATPGKQSL